MPKAAPSAQVTRRRLDGGDGWRLSVTDLCPPAPRWGVAVVGHAMMVNARTVYREDRPSLAATLAASGLRVLAVDLRGHGTSRRSPRHTGSWTYEQLVDDVGRYRDHCAELEPGAPVVLLGNSLFGHASLAHVGVSRDDGRAPVAAMVAFAPTIWARRWTVDRRRWWLKRAVMAATVPLHRGLGRLPIRALRLGTDDVPASYWQSMLDWAATDRWGPLAVDYHAALAHVRCPVLLVTSEGDPLLCAPEDAARFAAPIPDRAHWVLGPRCEVPALRSLRPGHVGMVSHPSCRPLWEHVSGWVKSIVARGAGLQGGGDPPREP